MAPPVMTGASMRMPPTQKMANLFQQIDTSGTGSISKSQFEQAFSAMNPPATFKSAGADAIFAKLDPNGTGSVSKQDFVSGMTSMMSELRQKHHHQDQARTSSASQALSSSTDSLNALGGTINTRA